MIFHEVMVAEERCNERVSWCVIYVIAHVQTYAYLMCEPSTLEAAGLWMSFPGDPEDCSKCVSVSLINSNTGAFGTCGQVNETQWEGTFSWFPPHQEAAGDGMRFSNSLPLSLSGSPSPPTGQSDTLFRHRSRWDVLLLFLAPHPSISVTSCWFSLSQFIFFWWDNQFGFVN